MFKPPPLLSRDEFETALLKLEDNAGKPVVIDTETSKVRWRQDRYLMGIAVCLPTGDYTWTEYFPVGHKEWDTELCPHGNLPEEWHDELREVLAEVIPVAHHMRFDQEVLEDWGLHFKKKFRYEYFDKTYEAPAWYDTLIMSFMEDENKYSHELDQLDKLVGIPKLTQIDSIAEGLGGWERLPPEIMGRYARRDAVVEWLLFKRFFASLQKQEGLFDLLPRENRITKIIQKIENRGVGIDVERAKQLSIDAQTEMRQILRELGFDPAKPSQLAHRLYALPPEGLGFRPESYSKRKSKEFSQGLPYMDDEILSRLNHPEVALVRRFRTLQKADSTWYRGLLDHVSPHDGRVHSTYKQWGAVTTRWTSSRANLNQLPRDVKKTPVKKLLQPRPGYELWEFDYSQQEVRMITVYAGIQALAEAYKRGDDVHAITAQRIGAYEKFPDDPVLARYVGKQANLGLQYMAGPATLGRQIYQNSEIQFKFADLKAFHAAYHDTYPEVKRFNYHARSVAEAQGYVTLWNKRRRHLTTWDCKKAGNSIIQGGCAQQMFDSMLLVDEECPDSLIVGQVYDSMWVEIPEEKSEYEVARITTLMREWVEDLFEFPFPVDSKRMN